MNDLDRIVTTLESKEPISRRGFLSRLGTGIAEGVVTQGVTRLLAGTLLGAAATAAGCATARGVTRTVPISKVKVDNPVFGPRLAIDEYYGGYADFKAHIDAGNQGGVDYFLPVGTLIIPAASGKSIALLRGRTHGDPFIYIGHRKDKEGHAINTVYGHLESSTFANDFPLEKRVIITDVGRDTIIGKSGNILRRRYGEPHLHFGVVRINFKTGDTITNDPFTMGPGGRRPPYWDGKAFIDSPYDALQEVAYLRVKRLNKLMIELEERVEPLTKRDDINLRKLSLYLQRTSREYKRELKANRISYEDLFGRKGYLIFDFKSVNDAKQALKEVTGMDEKHYPTYKPGHIIYTIALEILSQATKPDQELILTVPIALRIPGIKYSMPAIQF